MSGADRVLVVGASLAGATAAFALRDEGYDGDIVLVGAETELPYERPALSKAYLAGDSSLDALLVRPAEDYDQARVELLLGSTAISLDVGAQTVTLESGQTLSYTHLVIATGAANTRPPVEGLDLEGVHQLRTVADADSLRTDANGRSTAVVVGQGFIGCEIACVLAGSGLAVTAVDALPGPLWGPLGQQLSAVVARWHTGHGVELVNGVGVRALLPGAAGRVEAVVLEDGRRLPADLVVVGVGVRPATAWLLDSPVHLVHGAVGVDGEGRTDVPGVYAAGDVTATWDDGTGRHERHEHWASAIDQAQRVARAIAGTPQPDPVPPSFWSDQYDRTLLYVGSHDADSEVVLRGDPATDGPLVAFFLRAGRLAAALAIGDGKQVRRAQKLLGELVDPAALADPSVDLRTLVPAGG